MWDTHTGDKLPKIGIPYLDSSPSTFAAKRRTNLTGLTQQRETDSVQRLGLLPVTMTQKDPAGSVRARPEGHPGILTEKLSPESPCPDPCLRAPASSDPGESLPG